MQFIIEAVSLSTIGRIVGAGTGVLIAFVSSLAFSFSFVVSGWSIVIELILSTFIGLAAGVLPARDAAHLDPIVALQNE